MLPSVTYFLCRQKVGKSGLAGGGVEGFIRGVAEDKNPYLTALQDAGLASATGGAFGFGLGKIGQKIAGNKLFNASDEFKKNYFNDYVEGLQKSDKFGADSIYSKALGDYRRQVAGMGKGNFANLADDTNNSLKYRDEWVNIDGKDYRILNLPKKDYGKILHSLDTNIGIDDNVGDVLTRYDDKYAYTFQKTAPTVYKFIKRQKIK